MSASEWSEDFDDLIAELIEGECDFVVVGAHALAVHGLVRATGDLDILVRPTALNAERVVATLARFGAPLAAHGVRQSDFETAGMVYQIGLPPNRIDLLTEISGVSFDEALEGAPKHRAIHWHFGATEEQKGFRKNQGLGGCRGSRGDHRESKGREIVILAGRRM